MSKPNKQFRTLSDLTDEEARAEGELLRAEHDEADRLAAPLRAICWAEAEEEEDINPLDLN